jgi:glycosyltransferase involved in cell wall biosynthesis
MPSVYSALDILTLPSRAEGFPNSVGEAMACETPCVVCRVGDASEIVGNTGVVVPPDDPAQLRDGWVQMMNLSTDELTTRRVEARRRVEANFSLEALAGAMTRALAEV